MAVSPGYIESIVDQLRPLGRITIRKMFGGAAVYCDGQVFALVSDDVMYLKIDDTTRPDFIEEGCGPFEYPLKDGRVQVLASYHRAPDRLLDDTDDLVAWCRKAVSVGRNATKIKPTAKAKRTKAKLKTT